MRQAIEAYARYDGTLYLFVVALLLLALMFRTLTAGRAVLKHTGVLLVLCAGLEILGAVFAANEQAGAAGRTHQLAFFGLGLVLIRLSGLALFRLILPRLGIGSPRIVEDIAVIAAYVTWAMVRMTVVGVDLSSLVATSAVITAVLAFAMQDTLGNILGGLALQLDNSLEIGDWVKIDELSGRVVEIQWRYTAILTRNGEKVVVPNSQLMKGKFTVLFDPDLGIGEWRRWIWFNIDYSVPPVQVIAAIEGAIAEAEIPNVAKTPAASCLAMEFTPGSVRYALRYWLRDPKQDDPTDSAVRVHVLTTLQRAGWRVALPDQVVHMVKTDESHRQLVETRDLERRKRALAEVAMFRSLSEDERNRLAGRLMHAPFAQGAVITRQGAMAHWLYLLISGEVEVVWQAPNGKQCVLSVLAAGSLFGEMGLLMGAPRSATVIARTNVECYRLERGLFEDIIRERPELAASLGEVAATRQRENEELQNEFYRSDNEAGQAESRAAIVQRIRDFFGLD